MTIDATAHLAPPMPDVRAAVDRDGTIDDAHDDDEEWVIELAIPRATLPLDLPVNIVRNDRPKDGIQRRGTWRGTISLR
jgi:hypothetical protein